VPPARTRSVVPTGECDTCRAATERVAAVTGRLDVCEGDALEPHAVAPDTINAIANSGASCGRESTWAGY
jgi:hypothetical protein